MESAGAKVYLSLSLSVVLSSFELSFSLYVGAGRSRGRGNCVSGTVGVLATKTNFAFQQISACHLQWRFLLCSSCGIFWSGAHEGGLLKSFECLFSNAACVLIRMRCFWKFSTNCACSRGCAPAEKHVCSCYQAAAPKLWFDKIYLFIIERFASIV